MISQLLALTTIFGAIVVPPKPGLAQSFGKKYLYNLNKCVATTITVHYRQIHYIRVYEKSNFKSLIIGNLYVKLLAFLEKDPS